jgi:hypothetical protein
MPHHPPDGQRWGAGRGFDFLKSLMPHPWGRGQGLLVKSPHMHVYRYGNDTFTIQCSSQMPHPRARICDQKWSNPHLAPTRGWWGMQLIGALQKTIISYYIVVCFKRLVIQPSRHSDLESVSLVPQWINTWSPTTVQCPKDAVMLNVRNFDV